MKIERVESAEPIGIVAPVEDESGQNDTEHVGGGHEISLAGASVNLRQRATLAAVKRPESVFDLALHGVLPREFQGDPPSSVLLQVVAAKNCVVLQLALQLGSERLLDSDSACLRPHSGDSLAASGGIVYEAVCMYVCIYIYIKKYYKTNLDKKILGRVDIKMCTKEKK